MDLKHDPYSYHLHSIFAQLLALIRRGHYDGITEVILAEPAVLKLRDRMGRCALHHCADSFPVATSSSVRPNITADVGQLLIRMVPSMVEWQDNEGNIALHLAVINGDQALVRQLLRAMSVGQINIADYELHTAIHWSVVSGQLDTMTMALDHGADPSTPDIYGAYPIHYATQNYLESFTMPGASITRQSHLSHNLQAELATTHTRPVLPNILNNNNAKYANISSKRRAKSLRILHQLLTRPQIDVNCIDNEQRTPLIWAASSGNHDALLVLVKAGAEISQQDKDGLSALHCASSRGHYRCVDTLITMCGADVHQLDSGGCTPLFYAVALGHPDCVRLLIKSGAKLDHQDQKGRTAAHCGASKGQLETLKILHENGANLWLKNVRGDLPLHEAVKSGRVDLVKWLLDQSPKSVNEVNLYGRSPMHIAAFNHNLEMCRLLASYGADMNPVMKIRSQYLTPLDAALQNGSAHDELIEFLRQQGAQSITQIDHQLAEYMRKENDKQQNLNLTETDEEFNKFNVSRKMSSLRQQAASNIADVGFSGITTKGRSRSKPRDVRISDHPTMEEVKPRKSKSKPARFKVDVEPQIFADASATTKLPNLVTNGGAQKRAVSSSKSGSSSPLSSSPPNSVVHSATAHAHHHHHQQYTDRVKNVREFETIIDGGGSQGQNGSHKHHATHLKQAIITNVYLTAPAAAISTLTPVESTGAQLTTAGTALLPVYYVKRVPPLKKLSSSSSVGVGHKRMKKLNGKGKKPPRGVVSVLLETHDTYESGGRVSEQRISKQEELDLKNRTDSLEQEADDDGEEQEEEEGEGEEEDVEGEKDKNDEIEREDTEAEAKVGDLVDSLAVEREPVMMEERTPDSGFETEAMNRKESLKDFYQHRKESFKSDLQDRTSENQSDQKDQKEDSQSSASSEDEDEKIQKKKKKKDSSSSSSSSSDEDESKIEKQPKDSAGWLGSRLEEMAKSTTKTIDGTVGVVQDKLRFDGKKSIEDDDEEERNKEIPEELIHRDFVQSFNKDEQDDDGEDQDDDERRKRSVQLEPVTEVHLKKQKSTDSLQSVKSATAASVDDQAEDAGIDGADRKAEEDNELLIVMIKDEPKKDEGEESSIVEVFDEEASASASASAQLDDGQQQQPHEILDKIDEVADQTIQEGIQTVAEVEENLEEKLEKLAHPPTDLPEVDETMVVKKEIKFKGFDYDDQEGDDTESKEQPPEEAADSTGIISGGISTLKQEGAELLAKVDEKMENMEDTLGLKHRKSIDGEEEEDGQSKQETDDEAEASHLKQQQADSEAEPSAPTAEEEHEEQGEDHGADQQEPPDQMMVPVQRIRRGSYTKRSSLLLAEDPNQDEEGPNLKGESGSINYESGQGVHGGLDSSQENLHVNPSSPAFASSFGPVRQLKGKKKSYDHVRPKVNSYWSDEYHHQQHPRKDRSPGSIGFTGKHHGRYPHDDKHHHYHHYGSVGYLATTSNDEYARIDPKVINQTVEKYLRKYYLERQLFEELYDLKRYQIRTGKTNEPQTVKRLVDRFRREVKAPGMADFKGPYTYRAFEMYLYDLLRHLSRSNQRKIAYLTKSISYEDLASSFERLQAEAEAGSSDEFRRSHRRHARDHSDDRYYRYKLHSDLSSEETSDMAGGQHGDGDGEGAGGENRQSATTRHRSKFDPLTDYDRQPLGLVVDYKYEYHKSQHRAAGHGHSGELVDVILENLYKRTGMHGNKMDEMAVSRKIVERSGNEDNDGDDDDDDGHGGGHGDGGGADDKHLKPESRKSTKRHGADGAGVANEVWPDNDRNYRSYSRCSVYGHPGPSTTTTNDNSLNIKLARLSRTRQQPSRKRRFVRKKHQISIPMDQIRQRWHRIKRFERERHRNLLQQNDQSSSSVDSDFTLWFELNQKWRPRIEILEPY